MDKRAQDSAQKLSSEFNCNPVFRGFFDSLLCLIHDEEVQDISIACMIVKVLSSKTPCVHCVYSACCKKQEQENNHMCETQQNSEDGFGSVKL